MNLLNSCGPRTDGRAEISRTGFAVLRQGFTRLVVGLGWLAGTALGAQSGFDLAFAAPSTLPSPPASLRVNLQPTNIFAQWRLSWEHNWRDSGAEVTGLEPGSYPVEFKPVFGFLEPLVPALLVQGGITNEHSFTYTNSAEWELGSLTVVLRPSLLATAADVSARAQWRRQGESVWHDSGARLDALPAGSYGVEFKPVANAGWQAPMTATVAVGANRENIFTGNYFQTNTSDGDAPLALDFNSEVQAGFGNAPPYAFCGQLQTDLGRGSGVVVQQRIVLTAAHLVFDDATLAFVPNSSVRWFFQRHAGAHEPPPLTPRLMVALAGYAAQRAQDATPGIPSAAAQNLDVAALYFSESPGRGGYSGYVISKPDEEWLTNAPLATMAGYPVENVPSNARGQMHATPMRAVTWARDGTNWVYATTNLKVHPGLEGGPVCIQFTNGNWYPAGIILGGSNQTVVRVIDDAVASLIFGTFFQGALTRTTAGEPPRPAADCPTCSSSIYGVLEVSLQPTNLGAPGGGYRFRNVTNSVIYREPFNRFFVLGNVPWTIDFLPAPQSLAPATRSLTVTAGQTNRTTGLYKPWGRTEALAGGALRVLGPSGVVYRIDFKPALDTNAWTPVRTQTLSGAGLTLTNLVPGASNAFFRAVLLP